MKTLRNVIILLSIFIPVSAALMFQIIEPGSGKAASPFLTIPYIPTILLILSALLYARKKELSAGWIIGNILFPLPAALIMVFLHAPETAAAAVNREWEKTEENTKTELEIKRSNAEGKPLSPEPLCIWTPGTGEQQIEGGTWEEVADLFISSELTKDAPDLPALRKALLNFPDDERHGAWGKIAWAFSRKGDTGAANLSFLEGLVAHPVPNSTHWGNLQMDPDVLAFTGLDRRLKNITGPVSPSSIEKAERLAQELAKKTGLFNEPVPVSRRNYNRAVMLYRSGAMKEAENLLSSLAEDRELGLPALYLSHLCNPDLEAADAEKADSAGNAYLALGIAAEIIGWGGKAAYPKNGGSIMIRAQYKRTDYTVSVTTLAGSFMLMAWKKRDGKDIPLNDPSLNPAPSEADIDILVLLEGAPGAEPVPVPKEGIPDSL